MQVASVKPYIVCHRRGKDYFGARTRVLYNFRHKDYDNNLVKDNCWKEIAEVHAQGKEQATQYFVRHRKAYCWYAFV